MPCHGFDGSRTPCPHTPPGRRFAALADAAAWIMRTVCAALLAAGAAGVVGAVGALDVPEEKDEGYLPAESSAPGGAATVMDDRRLELEVDPREPGVHDETPTAPTGGVAAMPRTPGGEVLAARGRIRRAVEELSALLTARRPDLLRAGFGALRDETGGTVGLPLTLGVDPAAYARMVDDVAARVRALTGDEGALVDMPIHAESLAVDVIRLGAPWLSRANAVNGAKAVNGGNGANGANGKNGGKGARARLAYTGGMNLFLCLSIDAKPVRAVWPTEKDLVLQYNARWRVFDLDPALARGLAEALTRRHFFHVRAQLCDAAGRAVAVNPSDWANAAFTVEGLFLTPAPGHLLVVPWLTGRRTGHDGAQDAAEETEIVRRATEAEALLTTPDGSVRLDAVDFRWRRTALFDVSDDALSKVSVFRCRYGTDCLPDPDGAPCPLHPAR